MPLHVQLNLSPARALTIDDYEPSFAAYMRAAWGDADNYNPGIVTGNMLEASERRYGFNVMDVAEAGGLTGGLEELAQTEPLPAWSQEEQKAYIRDEGLEGALSPGEHYTRPELEFLARLKHEEIERKLTREKASAWYAPFGFLAGLGASFTDPINLATALVPVLPEARMMQLLAKSGSAWGRAGIRAGVGAAEGAVAAAVVEPMIIGGKTELQQEYGLADSLMNVVFGAAMGAVMKPAAGALGDWMRQRKGRRQPWEYVPSSDLTERLRNENAARIWAGMRESGAEKLAPEHAEAAAALWDAALRGYAYDTGELVGDVYARYRTEWRGGKMEIVDMHGDALEQAMYRSRADNIREFIAEVDKYGNKPVYVFGNIQRSDAGLENAALQLGGSDVCHIRNRHPDFNRWEEIKKVVNEGQAYAIPPNQTTKLPGRAFVIKKAGEWHAVLGYIQQTKWGPHFSIGTSFIDTPNKMEGWLKQIQATPFYQRAGSSPAKPKPAEAGRLSELKQGGLLENTISSLASDGNHLFQSSIVVRGDELGVPDGAGIKEYIAAAKKYHDALKYESEHGKPVMQPQLDKPVRFSGKGWRKNQNKGANPGKWKLFPKLRWIIENSTLIQTENVSKPRKDGFTRFHWVEADVELDGAPRRVGLMLAEDKDGNLFYNLNADVDEWAQKNGSSNLPAQSMAGESEPLLQRADARLKIRIPDSDDGVNLYILSEQSFSDASPRARVTFGEADAYAVVEFFKSADPSTAPHEMYHIFRRIMADMYDDPNASEASRERYRKACEFVGAEPGKVWTREQEEMFARAGERFLLEGVTPNPRMGDVMESFRQWIGEVYGNAERSGLEISDGMRSVFGKMMGTAEDGDISFRYDLGKLQTERLRNENAARIWAGMQESGAENLAPEHAEAAAALWDATLRGYAYDTGELVGDAYARYRTEWRGGKMEIVDMHGDALEQAMYRSRATTLEDFVIEARAAEMSNKAFFHTQEIMLNGESMPVELGTDQVRHITRRHSDFTEWNKIPDVIETGTPFFIGHSRYTRSPAFAYVLDEGGSSLLVIGSPMKGNPKRNRPSRVTALTAFRADSAAVKYWLSRFDNAASPSGSDRIPSSARGLRASLPSKDAALSPQGSVVMDIVTALDKELNEIAVMFNKERSSTHPNAGSDPSLLKPLNEDEVRVLEDLYVDSLHQDGRENNPRARVTFGEADAYAVVEFFKSAERGDALEQARIKSEALTLEDFADEARANPVPSIFIPKMTPDSVRKKFGIDDLIVEIRDDFIRHLDNDHGKNANTYLAMAMDVLQRAEEIDAVTGHKPRKRAAFAPRYSAVIYEEGKGRVVVFELLQSKDKGNRVVPITAYEGKEELVRDLMARKKPLPMDASIAMDSTRANPDKILHVQEAPVHRIEYSNLVGKHPTEENSPRARVTFGEADTYAMVEFFKSADPSTAPHEMYHIFRRIMADMYDDPNASEASRERYRKACEFVGAEPGRVWTREQEEMFARAGERFLLEGVTPNPRMGDVMESFRQWMGEVYGNAERSGLEISDGMRNVFGKMMGTAEDGDISFRYAMGRLLDYSPEKSIDTRVEFPAEHTADGAPEQALEAYAQDSAARLEEAYSALADRPEAQERFRAELEAEMAEADVVITEAQRRGEIMRAAAACIMRSQG